MRTRSFYGELIPSASSVEVYDCGDKDCHGIHLIGRDERGLPICEIVVSEVVINTMMDVLASKDGHHVHRVN